MSLRVTGKKNSLSGNGLQSLGTVEEPSSLSHKILWSKSLGFFLSLGQSPHS